MAAARVAVRSQLLDYRCCPAPASSEGKSEWSALEAGPAEARAAVSACRVAEAEAEEAEAEEAEEAEEAAPLGQCSRA